MAPRREHPPLRWFADRADGLLAPARTAALDAHLAAGCATCAARDASLRRTIHALRAGPLEAAPRALAGPARRLHRAARLAAVLDRAARAVARLVSDTRAAPAFAMRAAPGDERRLLWAVGAWEIDACLKTGSRESDLLGQVVPYAEREDAEVEGEVVARCGRRTVQCPLGEDGRFSLRGLAPGVWTIAGMVNGFGFALTPLAVERTG